MNWSGEQDRRLIEDHLPLDVLNAIAAKAKLDLRHQILLIHYYPARCPITAYRAAIYAALVPAAGTDEELEEAAWAPGLCAGILTSY